MFSLKPHNHSTLKIDTRKRDNMIQFAARASGRIANSPSLLILAGLGLLFCAGCAGRPAGPSGSTEDAGKIVSTALDAWKAGKKPAELQSQQPAVNVADQDWQAGSALKEYQLTGTPSKNGGSWRVGAKLTLSSSGQAEQQKDVAYDVTLQPAITILRADDVGE